MLDSRRETSRDSVEFTYRELRPVGRGEGGAGGEDDGSELHDDLDLSLGCNVEEDAWSLEAETRAYVVFGAKMKPGGLAAASDLAIQSPSIVSTKGEDNPESVKGSVDDLLHTTRIASNLRYYLSLFRPTMKLALALTLLGVASANRPQLSVSHWKKH